MLHRKAKQPHERPHASCVIVNMQNAYNLPATITPTQLAPGAVRSGQACGTPTCSIPTVFPGFCQAPNYVLGNDTACINANGPWLVSTAGTQAFKQACPDAYTYSTDYVTSDYYFCPTGTGYSVTFCPS